MKLQESKGLGDGVEVWGGQLGCSHVTCPFPTQFQEARQGSLCNQAIMLITDGAVEDYEPVFEKYNWPDRKVTLLVEVKGAREGAKGSVLLLPA